MEFEFNCEQVTKADKSGYAIVNTDKLYTLPKKSLEYMESLVDTMGKYSSKAQRLPSVITSFKRLQMNTDRQKLYIYSQKKQCFGYLKTGYKNLFVSTECGQMKEIYPLCVLDFYVSENVQRQGIGRKLFDLMLQDSGYRPEKIAYDRPSDKLLKFLSKHFGLKRYLPQNNNFVVFSQYFISFGGSKTKSVAAPLEKESEDECKSIYESKPSYKVTYSKGKKKGYDEGNNIVNKDYISNLISTSHNSNQKVKRMAANEESKDGFSQMYDCDQESSFSSHHPDKLSTHEKSFGGREPLVDTTNDTKKSHQYRNPILGDYEESKPVQQKSAPKDTVMQDETYVPSGADLDKLIKDKEAELQRVMGRLSVSSKQSTRKEEYQKAAPRKSNLPVYQPPAPAKVEAVPSHGHPSMPEFSYNKNVYSASGMRSVQFHSKAPWATEE